MRNHLMTVLISGTILACNSTQFGAGENKAPGRKSGDQQPSTGGKEETPEIEIVKPDIPIASDEGKRCIDKPMPMRVMFLIDSTASMTPHIQLVMQNVGTLTDKLQGITFKGKNSSQNLVTNIQFAAIAFKDNKSEQQVINFSDHAGFKTALQALRAEGGMDTVEGGLGALSEGITFLGDEGAKHKNQYIPVVIVVTDTLAHNGGSTQSGPSIGFEAPKRDCATDSFANKLSGESFKNLLIFDATPTKDLADEWVDPIFPLVPGVGNKCEPYSNKAPSTQWDDIRGGWQATRKNIKNAPGRNLGFPFSADDLIVTLPGDVAESFEYCE